jgi:hypothetical protein
MSVEELFSPGDLGYKAMMRCRANSIPQVEALLKAGWSFELPEIVNRKDNEPVSTLSSEPWQWYWRSPPKRKGSKGRKYWSTTQAFNALKRQSTRPNPHE